VGLSFSQHERKPMGSQATPDKLINHYLYDSTSKTVYFTSNVNHGRDDLQVLGSSDHPMPKSAAAIMLQQAGIDGGYTLKQL
jgi:hypothetical protein